MIVRIRLGKRSRRPKTGRNQPVALAVASLLTPAAVMALVLAIWPLTAALKFTGAFPIGVGLFSHWQVWLALACTLQCIAIVVNRSQPAESFDDGLQRRERQLINSRS
jgi:hypothetical protein